MRKTDLILTATLSPHGFFCAAVWYWAGGGGECASGHWGVRRLLPTQALERHE